MRAVIDTKPPRGTEEIVRLNLGAGGTPLAGYQNWDRKTGQEVYPLTEVDTPGGRTSLRDHSVDEIRASHVLEHFSHRQTLDVLKEWARVLKPGGVMKIAVPNFDYIVDRYTQGGGALPLEQYLFGGHVDDDDRHGAMFNRDKLAALMQMAGLGDIQPWQSTIDDCAKLPVSLNLMGVKGAPQWPNLHGKVAACFSVPRFGPLDPMFLGMDAFTKMNIAAIRKSGVFWHQCLSDCFELSIDQAKYILAIDYDSLFSPQDVLELYRLMERHPEAGAICPIQSGRDRSTPLMTVSGEDGKNRAMLAPEEMAKELLELRTGHFGLTMIRTELLKTMKKPWFLAQPDNDGGWGEGRVDSDIYFWVRFREQGFRLFQANRIAIGHGQWMASFPNQNLETQHQYVSEFLASGKPDWVWR